VKESPAKAVRPIKRTKKLSNDDLPDGVDLKIWRRSFVSTFMQYVGSSPNPWDIPAKLACEKMQLIWDARTPEYRSGTQMAVTNLCPDREDQILGIFVRMASGFQFFYAQNLSG